MDKVGDEGIAKTADKQIEIKLKSTTPTDPDDENVAVTGVTVTPASQEVQVGKSTTFIATVTPDNATNKKVTWTSSDESVATVNEDGVVTGVKAGTVTITATTVDGGITGTATIEVKEDDVIPTPVEPGNTEQPTIDGTTVKVNGENNDPTIATTEIPKAGISAILLMIIIGISALAVVIYKKNQDFKDIK